MAANQVRLSNSDANVGFITKIKLHNFVIYDEIEFFPGRNLNLITGANGSGKSTIVCGISLGLGGKVSNLGRGTCLSDFIKMGKDDAFIEIDLKNSKDDDIRIKHSFRREERKSHWQINDKHSSKSEVDKTISKLNIQVDNLCQFLPQDRVADFAKMNPKELLINTEKAINEELYDCHKELCDMHNFESKLKVEVKNLADHLEDASKKAAHWKKEYENLIERKKLLKTLDTLKAKKLQLKTMSVHGDYKSVKESCASQTSKLRSIEQTLAPLDEKIKVIQEKISSQDKNIQIVGRKLDSKVNDDKNRKMTIEHVNDDIRNAKDDYDRAADEEKKIVDKRQDLQKKIQDLQEKYETSKDESKKAQAELCVIGKKMNEYTNKVLSIEDEISVVEQDKSKMVCKINSVKSQLEKIQNMNKQRMEQLRTESRDASEAAFWLENNRDKFQSAVFLPAALTIQCKNDKFARYVEASIPRRDLISFMFESADDMDNFLKVIRDEKKLVVNAVQTPRKDISEFKPSIPIDELKRFGFISYVSDMFTCPNEVKAYLCQSYGIHNVPVGTEETHGKVNQIISTFNGLRSFFTHEYNYRISKSRYTSNTSTSSSEIRPVRLLSNTLDPKKVEEFQRNISLLREKLEELCKEQDKHVKCKDAITCQMEELRKQKRDLGAHRDIHIRVETRLKAFRDQYNSLENINMDVARKKHEKIIEQCVKRKADIMSKIEESVHDYSIIIKKMYRMNATKLAFNKDLEKMKNESEGKLNEKKDLLELVENLRKQEKNLLEQYKSLSSELYQKMRESKITKDELGEETSDEEEIDTKIAEFEARAELQAREVDDIEKQYEDSKQNLERIQKSFDVKNKKLESFVSDNKEKRDNWQAEVTDVIQTISSDFGNLMSYLDCAGEVCLGKPPNENDYENYGICIKVKFRDNEELMELSSKRQSGGERAVSTVLYMLSLQKLTSAPFRVVDEINQGMDATNERKVYELLIKHVCSPSQYFMLTPKLLPDLIYPTNITFICVQKTIKNFGLTYDTLNDAYDRFLNS